MVIFRNVSEGKSLFKLIDEFWLSESANDRAFHRICSLMRKMGVKTAIVENIESDDNIIKEEKEALSRYFDYNVTVKTFRISFSTDSVENEESLKEVDKNNSFLANVTIMNFEENRNWHSYILSAIVGVPKIKYKENEQCIFLLNNYIHNAQNFDCHIKYSDRDVYTYRIFGTYFCQQNSFTSVCAHAALCMIVNNQKLFKISTLEPEDLNRFLNINHKSKKLSRDKNNGFGVSDKDIIEFLEIKGLSVTSREFFSIERNAPTVDYSEFLYGHIESRHPCLLIFSTKEEDEMHTVPIIGHTLNTDLWKPEAEIAYSNNIIRTDDVGFQYRSASAWVDHFIIHDDNFGVYYCLPTDLLRRRTKFKDDPQFRAIKAIVIIPKGLETSALGAERNSLEIMKRNVLDAFLNKIENYWFNELAISLITQKTPFVVRTILTKREDYQQNLNYSDFNGQLLSENEKNEIIEILPERFWLTEVTLPDLYTANKTKLVDIFYRSDIHASDIEERWIQTRIPGFLIKHSNKEYIPLGVKSHYPLLRFNENYKVYEW